MYVKLINLSPFIFPYNALFYYYISLYISKKSLSFDIRRYMSILTFVTFWRTLIFMHILYLYKHCSKYTKLKSIIHRKQGQKNVHKNVSQACDIWKKKFGFLQGKCRLCISQTLFFHNVQRLLFLQSINNLNRRKREFLNKKVIVCDLEWPLRSYLILQKKLCFHNVSIYTIF